MSALPPQSGHSLFADRLEADKSKLRQLRAPTTKQIQVDSIFAVRSKLRQLRAPATNKLTRNVNDLRVFCWLEKILNIANLFVGANRGQT